MNDEMTLRDYFAAKAMAHLITAEATATLEAERRERDLRTGQ